MLKDDPNEHINVLEKLTPSVTIRLYEAPHGWYWLAVTKQNEDIELCGSNTDPLDSPAECCACMVEMFRNMGGILPPEEND